MINDAKIRLDRMLKDIREHIREFSNSHYEQHLFLTSCIAQFNLWKKELGDEVGDEGWHKKK